jgi:hypothetical protein
MVHIGCQAGVGSDLDFAVQSNSSLILANVIPGFFLSYTGKPEKNITGNSTLFVLINL